MKSNIALVGYVGLSTFFPNPLAICKHLHCLHYLLTMNHTTAILHIFQVFSFPKGIMWIYWTRARSRIWSVLSYHNFNIMLCIQLPCHFNKVESSICGLHCNGNISKSQLVDTFIDDERQTLCCVWLINTTLCFTLSIKEWATFILDNPIRSCSYCGTRSWIWFHWHFFTEKFHDFLPMIFLGKQTSIQIVTFIACCVLYRWSVYHVLRIYSIWMAMSSNRVSSVGKGMS